MASVDDVPLPDLQVIQRYSLAVRGATAPRADLIAALEADLAWLTGTARRRTTPAVKAAPVTTPPAPAATKPTASKPTASKPAAKAPAKKAAAKKPASKAPAKKASTRGGRRA